VEKAVLWYNTKIMTPMLDISSDEVF